MRDFDGCFNGDLALMTGPPPLSRSGSLSCGLLADLPVPTDDVAALGAVALVPVLVLVNIDMTAGSGCLGVGVGSQARLKPGEEDEQQRDCDQNAADHFERFVEVVHREILLTGSDLSASLADRCNVCYMADLSEWLLVSASTGKSATLRVFVWRQMRRLGAVHLGPSVGLLPMLPAVSEVVNRMVDRVRADGGKARAFTVTLTAEDAEQVKAEQRADRDREYAEVLERVPAFLAEIETETGRGRATYTEVEESEADLGRFERWLDSIRSRDYFDAPGAASAAAAVDACRTALAGFEAKAVAADTADEAQQARTRDQGPSGTGVL